jgi:two-component system, NtrC family, sensor histidine kinase PilS
MIVENLKRKATAAPLPLIEKASKLATGRIFVLLFLLMASWVWNVETSPEPVDHFARLPLLIFAVALAIAVVFRLALFIKKQILLQVFLQFSADAVLITWLVWATGDVKSPYVTLYTILICLASIFFGARGSLAAASVSTIVFSLLAMFITYEYLPHLLDGSQPLPVKKALQIIGLHDVAFLVVGLLAAQLASRQKHSTERLEETVQTLTNLQRLNERIVQSIRSGLVTTDLEGKIYLFNSAAEEITGYSSDDVRGWKIFDLLGSIEQPIAVSLEASLKGEPPPRFETDFLTPEGFGIRLGYGVSPLFSEAGETTGLIVTFQDLTQMRSMEENIRRKDRLAAVGRVAAGLAHEIRNPLGAMRGAIQVLQSSVAENPSQAQLMNIVLRESDRLNTIITNFLSYARPQKGEIAENDIGEIIWDSVTLLRHSPDVRSNHRIIAELPEQIITAQVDGAGLKQVFWNLARNAVQAMPDGGELTVKLSRVGNNRLQITFADTGRGMPAAQVERLFEPFSQSTTGGTGLGLSIVYQIIRDHNGTINIRSRQNEGTTITVELPCEAPSSVTEKNHLNLTAAEIVHMSVPLDGVKVFDDASVVNKMQQML